MCNKLIINNCSMNGSVTSCIKAPVNSLMSCNDYWDLSLVDRTKKVRVHGIFGRFENLEVSSKKGDTWAPFFERKGLLDCFFFECQVPSETHVSRKAVLPRAWFPTKESGINLLTLFLCHHSSAWFLIKTNSH